MAPDSLNNVVSSLVPKQKPPHPDGERTWNNFQLRRNIFRSFSQFYKQKVADLNKVWQRQKVNKKKKQTIPEMIDNFVGRSGEFEDLL